MTIDPQHDSRATSPTLIGRAKQNDEEAWQAVVQSYAPLIYYWCRHARVPDDDVPDLVQEVFRSVHAGLSRFQIDEQNGSFRGWLRTITRSRLQDYYRRNQGRVLATGGTDAHATLAQVADAAISEVDTAVEDETTIVLKASLERLRAEFEETTWQAFWRTAVDEKYPADVAEQLGISTNAVYKAKSRVLRRLRDELQGLEEVTMDQL